MFLIQTVFASEPNCLLGTIESIRIVSDAKELVDNQDYTYEEEIPDTFIKVDTIEGECYTSEIVYRAILLRVFSAYPFGIQIQPHSLGCLSGYNKPFMNFTLTRE